MTVYENNCCLAPTNYLNCCGPSTLHNFFDGHKCPTNTLNTMPQFREDSSYSLKNQQLVLLPYQLSKKWVNSWKKRFVCKSSLKLSFSVQIWLSVRCPKPLTLLTEKLKSMCDNLGAAIGGFRDGAESPSKFFKICFLSMVSDTETSIWVIFYIAFKV